MDSCIIKIIGNFIMNYENDLISIIQFKKIIFKYKDYQIQHIILSYSVINYVINII